MDDYVRLLIMISICCCIVGFLMWLFLKWYKKASIWIPLLCTILLLIRFMYPREFSFTHTIGVSKGYPTLNKPLFHAVHCSWQNSFLHCAHHNKHLDTRDYCVSLSPALSLLQAAQKHLSASRSTGSGCFIAV